MAGGERIAFTLRLGTWIEDDLLVRRVIGEEALSEPSWFEVELVPASGNALELAPLLAAEAVLCLRRPEGAERWVHGLCAAAELVRVEAGRPAYRVLIVPRLALLGQSKDCRVFQERTAVEIVTAVLDQHGVAHREALSGRYPVRDLCIQYRESDLAFVQRLLAEEGIAYWFEHGSDGHTVVLGDAPSAFPGLATGERLPYRREVGALGAEAEHVYALRQSRAVVPGSATLRDYDFERPMLEVTATARGGAGAEHYDAPAGNVQPAEARRLTQLRLERLQAMAETFHGEATAISLAPGSIFQVEDHPEPAFDARLLAIRVEHEGRQETSAGAAAQLEDAYRNRFVAVPAAHPWRPSAAPPRGRILGPQTATVVGPPGEDIHTDRYGRVKVQFHWDRQGKNDDTACAWVRPSQPWAGPGMGALVVPRIGQEVVIGFLEGDPDRPLVEGVVYNGGNPPPLVLPHERTRSTFRTATSPNDGIGHNELRFEDQADAEEVHLHGQKDAVLETEHDKDQRVRGDEALEVWKDRSRTVLGAQTLQVGVDDAARVNGGQTLQVDGNRETTVGGSFAEAVAGNQSLDVGGTRDLVIDAEAIESVGAAASLTIGAGYAVNVGLAMNEAVGGAKTVEVGGASVELVGAHREETVLGDRETKVGGDFTADVAERLHVSVGKDLSEQVGTETGIQVDGAAAITSRHHTIVAERFNLIVGGKKILSLEKDGRLVISANSVTVNGKKIALRGATIAKIGPAAAAAGQAKIEQARALDEAPAVARFTLVDLDGQPMVNQLFELKTPDGALRKGKTSAEGQVRMPVPARGRYELTIAKPEGEDRTEANPRRGKTARRGARPVERGKTVKLPTDVEHVLELPERVVMTVAYFAQPGTTGPYPRFVLESSDGSYRAERTHADLVQLGEFQRLRFEGLRSGLRYTLTKWTSARGREVLFREAPYAEVVDQERRVVAEQVETHRFVAHGARHRRRGRT